MTGEWSLICINYNENGINQHNSIYIIEKKIIKREPKLLYKFKSPSKQTSGRYMYKHTSHTDFHDFFFVFFRKIISLYSLLTYSNDDLFKKKLSGYLDGKLCFAFAYIIKKSHRKHVPNCEL